MAEKVEHLSATMAEYQQDQANKQREIQQLKTANAEKAARMVRNACRVWVCYYAHNRYAWMFLFVTVHG